MLYFIPFYLIAFLNFAAHSRDQINLPLVRQIKVYLIIFRLNAQVKMNRSDLYDIVVMLLIYGKFKCAGKSIPHIMMARSTVHDK